MEYTVKEYIRELEKRQKQVKDANNIFKPASTAHALQVTRIFDDGLNCQNQPLGEYSTDQTYINTKTSSPKVLKPEGKTGQSVFANGDPHKTTYFASGYKEFKSRIGRGNKVNFRLFDDLKLDFQSSLQRDGNKWISGTKRKKNSDKIDGLTARYGQCSFKLSKQEREEYKRLLGIRLNNIMRGDAQRNN